MTVGVLVRVTPQERELWKQAAAQEGLSLSEMVRRTMAAQVDESEGP